MGKFSSSDIKRSLKTRRVQLLLGLNVLLLLGVMFSMGALSHPIWFEGIAPNGMTHYTVGLKEACELKSGNCIPIMSDCKELLNFLPMESELIEATRTNMCIRLQTSCRRSYDLGVAGCFFLVVTTILALFLLVAGGKWKGERIKFLDQAGIPLSFFSAIMLMLAGAQYSYSIVAFDQMFQNSGEGWYWSGNATQLAWGGVFSMFAGFLWIFILSKKNQLEGGAYV